MRLTRDERRALLAGLGFALLVALAAVGLDVLLSILLGGWR